MNTYKFIENWMDGAQVIGKMVAICAVFWIVIAVLIGVAVTFTLLPEYIISGIIVVLLVIFCPWAMGNTWG